MKWCMILSPLVSVLIMGSGLVKPVSEGGDGAIPVAGRSTLHHVGHRGFCQDPYGICRRKMPSGGDFRIIVSPSFCKWKRVYYKDPKPMYDGEARYTNGKDSVFMLFSLQPDAATLKGVFETIKKEAIESDNLIAKEEPPADPAWLKVRKGQHVFFAWTRKNYIFSCESFQGWKAVNEFMKCFPY